MLGKRRPRKDMGNIYNMRSTSNSTRKRPPHIEEQVWTTWNAIWSFEDFKKKSEQNKRNRRKDVADGQPLPTHNGGSAIHEQIAIDLVSIF